MCVDLGSVECVLRFTATTGDTREQLSGSAGLGLGLVHAVAAAGWAVAAGRRVTERQRDRESERATH